jgi:hypothetical protein
VYLSVGVCVCARALVDVRLVEEHGLLDDDFERLDVLFNGDLEAVFKLVHLSQHLPHRTACQQPSFPSRSRSRPYMQRCKLLNLKLLNRTAITGTTTLDAGGIHV